MNNKNSNVYKITSRSCISIYYSIKYVYYRFRVTEGYSNAVFRENGIPISAFNHNDSTNKIYIIITISLENGVYYIYAYYKDFYTGKLKFTESDFDCVVWYIPN